MNWSLGFRRAVGRTLAISMLLLAGPWGQSVAQTGNQLFQQALTKERAEGKLDEAIALYQRILREHAAEHPLAAKTLVQLGRAYERLGKDEARKAYDRVLRDYPDQGDAVKEARDRIAALGTSGPAQQGLAESATARRVLAKSFGLAVTPDGRALLGEDSTGNLTVLDLSTGRRSQLTHTQSDYDEYADYASASEDGRLFAFAWWNGPKNNWELRLVDRISGVERVLISDTTVAYIHPYSFTRDNKFVVAAVSPPAGTSTLSLVSTTTGGRERLVTYRGRDPQNAALSPDGRFLVYDVLDESTGNNRDIRILSMSGHADTVLVHHPANDMAPAWSPKGDGVFFVSTRDGSRAGWYVPVRNGRAIEAPRLVLQNVGNGGVFGLTRQGDLYYSPARTGRRDLFLADFDPSAGTIIGQPRAMVARTAGWNEFPSWSADSKSLGYTAIASPDRFVRVRNAETGAESEARVPSLEHSKPLGDTASIVSSISGGAWHLSLVDLRTGKIKSLVDLPDSAYLVSDFEPTRDGRLLYYLAGKEGRSAALMRYDLATGVRQPVPGYPEKMAFNFALSADGRRMAVVEDDRQGKRPGQRLRIISLEGDTTRSRLLGRVDAGIATIAGWLPDERGILMLARRNGSQELWLVPTDGSVPRKLNVTLASGTTEATLSPDGRHLALRIDAEDGELWVAQRFLPSGGR
ncbi:MAG TPA: tetratricopeptide repeat protein [Gemmatimonadaceae bacterium]